MKHSYISTNALGRRVVPGGAASFTESDEKRIRASEAAKGRKPGIVDSVVEMTRQQHNENKERAWGMASGGEIIAVIRHSDHTAFLVRCDDGDTREIAVHLAAVGGPTDNPQAKQVEMLAQLVRRVGHIAEALEHFNGCAIDGDGIAVRRMV